MLRTECGYTPIPMDSPCAVRGRVAAATAGVLVAAIVAATATIAGSLGAGGPLGGSSRQTATGPGASAAADSSAAVRSEPYPPVAAAPAAVAPVAAVAPEPSRPAAPSRAPSTSRPAPARAAPASPGESAVRRPPPRPNRASEAPTQPPSSPAGAATAAPPETTARYGQDFPDPFVYRSGAYWYAVSTQRGWSKVPMIRSADLVYWEERGDALASLPRWSRFGALWAPSVQAVEGGFVLYYSTTEDATGLQCVSSGFSVLAEGPFVDASNGPLVCQRDRGGSIDPSPFRDAAGRPWLAWKSEGTTAGEPTRLWSQPLSADGRSLSGDAGPSELLVTGLPWEGPIIEAPSMFVGSDGAYHLLYSGNRWETSSYAIGHARCAGPAGPCRRSSSAPVASSHPSEAGSGGAEVFRDPIDGAWRVAYHAWDPSAVGYPGGLRQLRLGALRVSEDGSMRVEPMTR